MATMASGTSIPMMPFQNTIRQVIQKEIFKEKPPVGDKIKILQSESSTPVTSLGELSF